MTGAGEVQGEVGDPNPVLVFLPVSRPSSDLQIGQPGAWAPSKNSGESYRRPTQDRSTPKPRGLPCWVHVTLRRGLRRSRPASGQNNLTSTVVCPDMGLSFT